MQRAVNNGSTISGLSSVIAETHATSGNASLYRHLGVHLVRGIYSDRLFLDLGNKMVALAEQAYGLRQPDKLGELSQILVSLPLPPQYASAARYFRGLELIRRGELDAAESVLVTVLADPPHRYTARAHQSLAAVFKIRGDLESSMRLHIEAGRRAADCKYGDLLTRLFVQKNIAVLKSMQGDHRGALNDLEQMVPLTKAVASVYMPLYYDCLNSLAVELCETGRIEEAQHASRAAISSPLAKAYPEWRQTFDEIVKRERQRASRSAVAVREYSSSKFRVEYPVTERTNLIHISSAKRANEPAPADRRPRETATVLNFQHWKRSANASNRTVPKDLAPDKRNRMTIGEKLIKLMDLISHDETDDETIDKILKAVEQIVPKRRGENLQ